MINLYHDLIEIFKFEENNLFPDKHLSRQKDDDEIHNCENDA